MPLYRKRCQYEDKKITMNIHSKNLSKQVYYDDYYFKYMI